MEEAGPFPILRPFHQSARDRIAVHGAQLLDSLAIGENIEVVIAPLGHPFLRDGYAAADESSSRLRRVLDFSKNWWAGSPGLRRGATVFCPLRGLDGEV